MDASTRTQVESLIVRHAIDSLIDHGYRVSTYIDSEMVHWSKPTKDAGEIMALLMQSEVDDVLVSKDGHNVGIVEFVYGNDGWDALANYTANTTLEGALKRTSSFASILRDADQDGTLWQFLDADRLANELKRQMDHDNVRVSWTPFDGSDYVEATGDLLAVDRTTGGAYRVEVRTDKVSPTDGHPIYARRYFPSVEGALVVPGWTMTVEHDEIEASGPR